MAANMVSQGILSFPVQQAAEAQQLGPFTKTYKTTLVRTIIAIIFFLGCAAVCFIGGTVGGQIVLLIVALGSLALVGYFIYTAITVGGQKIHLFQYGIVIERGDQVQPFPWIQASEVLQSITRHYRNGIYVGTTYLFTLRRADGYQIKLNNMTKNIAELGPAVAKGITQALVPRALNSLSAGQTLPFPPFSINMQGISKNNDFVPWGQIQSVNVVRGYLQIKKIGSRWNWGNVAVSKIPNFLVLTVVADEMRRIASGAR